jgi:hypothetical protein
MGMAEEAVMLKYKISRHLTQGKTMKKLVKTEGEAA